MTSSIAIIIATHNRSASLARTLESMSHIERRGVDAVWLIVNNACDDNTDAVAASYRNRLPLQLMHEPIPGKNRAVNLALGEALRRDVVVFTDDDVMPSGSWLREIAASCARWQDHDVFGGRILPRWPDGRTPRWATCEWMLSIGFARHDFGSIECEYPPGHLPFGPNFWMRSRIFTPDLRFPEEIGPAGCGRIMGSETALLHQLFLKGHPMVYCPAARVDHLVKRGDCDIASFTRRMHSHGRGRARIHGIGQPAGSMAGRAGWKMRQQLKRLITKTRMTALKALPESPRRNEKWFWHHSEMGWIEESLRIAAETPAK